MAALWAAVVSRIGKLPRPISRWLLLCVMAALLCGTLWAGLLLCLHLSPPLPLLEGLSFSPVVLDRQGQLLRMGLTTDDKFRARVGLADIAPQAVQAVLLYEDRHFYRHPGVNPLALARALWAMARGERRMGGSTITMQVVRLRLGLDTTTVTGKLRQMWLALVLERQYSKQQVLEAYFCLAPYGGNVEGIAAAARIYFGHAPAHLSLAESLALAPVPQNPVRRWPLPTRPAAMEAAAGAKASAKVGADFAAARARMEKLWAEAHPEDAAQLSRSGTLNPLRVLGPGSLPFEAPHVCAALLTAQAAQAGHAGQTAQTSQTAPVFSSASASPATQPTAQLAGQPTVLRTNETSVLRTTLSLPLQKMLEQRLADFVARGRVYGLTNAAAMLLHWPSMEIRVLAGSAKFGDARIFGQVDGTLARRSPGSTLKPFIYALALDQGLIHPQTLLLDAPRAFGGYDPENFDRSFRGPLPAHEALRSSRNIPAIGLASRLSPDLYSFLQNAEVKLPFSAEHYGLSLVLGGAEVSMRELVQLYAMLPNKGVWRPARLLVEGGQAHSGPAARALLSPEAAVLTLHMLEEPGREVRAGRTGRTGLAGQGAWGRNPLPHRYKTGTSNRFRDAWTVGVVGQYVLAVWAGNFDNSPNPLLVGGDVAAPLFEDMAEALSLREVLTDAVPAMLQELNVIRIPVCTDTGDLDIALCARTTETWYIPGTSPTRSTHIYRTILVDSRTRLRACQPSEFTREEVREFWPSDLQALFARAGIAKPAPPPYGPECAGMEGDAGQSASVSGHMSWQMSWQQSAQQSGQQSAGRAQARFTGGAGGAGAAGEAGNAGEAGAAPRILSPRDGVVYQRRIGDGHSGRNAIPLSAGVDADVSTVFWFVDDRFVGRRVVREGEAPSDAPSDAWPEPLLWQPEGGTHTVRVVDNLGRASVRRVRVETLP